MATFDSVFIEHVYKVPLSRKQQQGNLHCNPHLGSGKNIIGIFSILTDDLDRSKFEPSDVLGKNIPVHVV